MGRSPCCDDIGVKKGPWTPEEDQKLVDHIQKHGHGSWRHLPKSAGLNRCGKSCRLRWTNYLRPDIKRGKFSEEEERLIIHLHSVLGNKWSSIAAKLQGRTDNEIKNHWNTHLRKKLLLMGIDPVTHRRRTNLELLAGLPNLLSTTNIGNLASTWDQALQLQADAAQFARMQIFQGLLQLLSSPEYNNNSSPSLDLSSLTGASFASTLQSFNGFQGHPGSTQTNLSAFGASETPSFDQLPSLLFEEEQEIASKIMDNISKQEPFMNFNSNAAATNSIPSLVPSSPEHTDVVLKQELVISSNATSAAACSSNSAPLDAWDALHVGDTDAADLCWKDILEYALIN